MDQVETHNLYIIFNHSLHEFPFRFWFSCELIKIWQYQLDYLVA